MLLQSRYEYDPKKDLLGKGGFARVYKARDTLLDRNVAIKIFNNTGHQQYDVLQEIKKVIQLEHPNLLRYYDVILLDQANALGEKEQLQIGVMEYANAGDLKQFATKHPNSPLLLKFLHQVLTALEYLHKKGIIHRDLKAQNVLLIEEHGELTAKLSDFGIIKDTNATTNSASMMVGTIEYMAPEQFSPLKYGIDGKIGSNVDLWSFGIMVHELITQTTPFGSRDGNTTAEQIMSSILSTEQPKDFDKLPEPYRKVVKKCLVANARERIRKASELIQYFEGTQNQGSRSSNNSTANQHQAGDDQSTKVYGKTRNSNSSKQDQDDKTKVYGKQGQTHTVNKYNPTKTNQNDNKLRIKYPKSWQSRLKLLAIIIIANILIVNVLEVLNKKQYELAQAEIKQKEIEDRMIQVRDAIKNQEFEKAYELLLIVVESGNPEAQVMLGTAYLWGFGVSQDYNKAIEWYSKAVEQNYSGGQASMGSIYEFGSGVAKDYEKAMEWYLKASEQNDSFAQYRIGYMYELGEGVPKSIEEAKKWYQKAAESGQPDAIEALERIK